MRHILFFPPVLILLICASACTSTEVPTPKLPPDGPDLKAQFRVKLEVARYELQLYEEELKATKEKIQQAEARKTLSPSLLNWENELKGKVIQTKVKIREFEVFITEKP